MNIFFPFDLGPRLPPPTEEEKARWREEARLELRRQAGLAVPWLPDIKWKPLLFIQADSYSRTVRDLFPEVSEVLPGEEFIRHQCVALSPSGRYCYAKKILPADITLQTISGSKKGRVFFDGSVLIPMLFERKLRADNSFGSFPEAPWMSLTPMELISLRPGTKIAKGHTVIAGMGLGHQLIEVSYKKGVTAVTLVERSQELVDWLLPRIQTHMNPSMPFRVLIGDAYEIIPQLTADVALIDIFKRYGNNRERWYSGLLGPGGRRGPARPGIDPEIHQHLWYFLYSRRGSYSAYTRPSDQEILPRIKKLWIWGG